MIRIAVTGPESSGKTTLCKFLSEQLSLEIIPEYSREYLSPLKRIYTFDDVTEIGKEQFRRNSAPVFSGKGVVCDTELSVILIWQEDKFQQVANEIVDLWEKQKFDAYLLCYPDIPWEPDPMREDPERREELFTLYEEKLQQKEAHVKVIKGSNRNQQALNFILANFSNQS